MGTYHVERVKERALGGKTSRCIISMCFAAGGEENGKDEKWRERDMFFFLHVKEMRKT